MLNTNINDEIKSTNNKMKEHIKNHSTILRALSIFFSKVDLIEVIDSYIENFTNTSTEYSELEKMAVKELKKFIHIFNTETVAAIIDTCEDTRKTDIEKKPVFKDYTLMDYSTLHLNTKNYPALSILQDNIPDIVSSIAKGMDITLHNMYHLFATMCSLYWGLRYIDAIQEESCSIHY